MEKKTAQVHKAQKLFHFNHFNRELKLYTYLKMHYFATQMSLVSKNIVKRKIN